MAELLFDEEADALLTRLENDPAADKLVGRLHSALDRLEADPGDAWCRRRRFQTIALWGIGVVSNDEEWLILWEYSNDTDDAVIVHAIVPAP